MGEALMGTQATFCMKCGNPLDPEARFCRRCGAPRADVVQLGATATPAGAAGEPAAAIPTAGASPAIVARQVMSTAGTVASMGGLLSLPWQTIVVGESPDIRRLVSAGAPIAQRAVVASLKRPALALLVTTLLDLTVALISGRPGALWMVGLRTAMGVGTAVLGMIVGSKGGALRQFTGAASIATGLVQTGSLLLTAFSAAISPVGVLGLIPSILTQASSLVMLVKTAMVSLKRLDKVRPGAPLPAEQPIAT